METGNVPILAGFVLWGSQCKPRANNSGWLVFHPLLYSSIFLKNKSQDLEVRIVSLHYILSLKIASRQVRNN